MTRFLTVLALSAVGLVLTAGDAAAFGGRKNKSCAPPCPMPCAPVCHMPCPPPMPVCHAPVPAPVVVAAPMPVVSCAPPCPMPCPMPCPAPCAAPCGKERKRLFGGGLFGGRRGGCGC